MILMSSYGLERMPREECLELLRTRGFGRVGLEMGDHPEILPVNYAVLGDDVVFRTDPGAKLSAAVLKRKVAFEVDQTQPFSHEGWSVLVVGHAEEVRDRVTLDDVNRLPLRPWVDGVRDQVVRIRAEQVTGRRIVHTGNGHA
jgi:nitroimidazol reductase NimA-like FMN-containing flavoprotein (pyridoxamine 5'-phosphate oxidase superfamily)